jgi:hypothetical protein
VNVGTDPSPPAGEKLTVSEPDVITILVEITQEQIEDEL